MKNRLLNSFLILTILCLSASLSFGDSRNDGSAGSFDNLPGQWTHSTYSDSVGSREYYLYVPQNTNGGAALPLMVMLHGCSQDVPTFAKDTGMNLLAEKYGFIVVYPVQSSDDNPMNCWNWFLTENQQRNSGELEIVVGIVGKIQNSQKIDRQHIFAVGISAGGAMVSNLLACYADLFSGGGIESGLEYEAATSAIDAVLIGTTGPSGPDHDFRHTAADAAQCTGAGAKMPALAVFHGSKDPYLGPINADRIMKQFTAINDLFDDGRANDSQLATPIESSSAQVPKGYKYTTETFGGGGSTHIMKVMVEGMGHAWSGATRTGQYADPKGPNASEMMWQFMSKYSLNR